MCVCVCVCNFFEYLKHLSFFFIRICFGSRLFLVHACFCTSFVMSNLMNGGLNGSVHMGMQSFLSQYLRTNNPIVDGVLSLLLSSLLVFLLQSNWSVAGVWATVCRWFTFKSRRFELEIQAQHDDHMEWCSADHRAISFFMCQHMSQFTDVHRMKQYPHMSRDEMFVDQIYPLQIDAKRQIFLQVHVTEERSRNTDGRLRMSQQIKYTLFSHETNIEGLRAFLKEIRQMHITTIASPREHQRFLYQSRNAEKLDMKQRALSEWWSEQTFQSNRNFDNVFFDGKEDVLQKINFFLNNKAWYDKRGIPYNLGIGLRGPPGSGKTSFIKALIKLTNRHAVKITPSHLHNVDHLHAFFFEQHYCSHNHLASRRIGFDQKIIIFEDIDCLGEFVMDRKLLQKRDAEDRRWRRAFASSIHKRHNFPWGMNAADSDDLWDSDDEATLTKTTCPIPENNNTSSTAPEVHAGEGGENDPPFSSLQPATTTNAAAAAASSSQSTELPSDQSKKGKGITLDELLNVLDGINETSGRIMVITSNYYDQLDEALIRPGRIDITLNFGYASHNVIAQMFENCFEVPIDNELLLKVTANAYTPAHVMNCFTMNYPDGKKGMETLIASPPQNPEFLPSKAATKTTKSAKPANTK